MSKQVKDANEHFEGRDILEQRKLKHLPFQLSFFVVVKKTYMS